MTETTARRPLRTDPRYCLSDCPACDWSFNEDAARWDAKVEDARRKAQATADEALKTIESTGGVFFFLGKSLDYWRRLDKLVRTERPDLARKAETPPREYLFLGGPAHGKRIATELETYRVPVPAPLNTLAQVASWAAYTPEPLKTAVYRRRQVAIADRGETVYTYEGTN